MNGKQAERARCACCVGKCPSYVWCGSPCLLQKASSLTGSSRHRLYISPRQPDPAAMSLLSAARGACRRRLGANPSLCAVLGATRCTSRGLAVLETR